MPLNVEQVMAENARLKDLYKTVFKGAGKEIFEDLEKTFSDRSSIVPGDPYATHAREGSREVVLYIKNMMEVD